MHGLQVSLLLYTSIQGNAKVKVVVRLKLINQYDFDCIKCGRHFKLPIPNESSMPETPPDSEVGDSHEDKTGDNNETMHFEDFVQQSDNAIDRYTVINSIRYMR